MTGYARRSLNIEWLIKERERGRLKSKRDRANGRKIPCTAAEKWKKANPEKAKAQQAANRAFRRGLIQKPTNCEWCKKETSTLHKHHEDYSKPLCVQWICYDCHGLSRRKPIPKKNKEHLGDSVYVEIEDGIFKLTSENGFDANNTIFLKRYVYDKLVAYANRAFEFYKKPAALATGMGLG